MSVRLIFTDSWNSLWHVVFGILATRFWLIIPIFLLYQFVLKYDENSIIDTAEFFIGYFFHLLVQRIIKLKPQPL
jgi:hypothetical protein